MSFSENMIIEFARRCVSSDKKISLLTPGGFITGFIDTTVPYLNDECNTMSYIAFLNEMREHYRSKHEQSDKDIPDDVLLIRDATVLSGGVSITFAELFVRISEITAFSAG